MLKINIVVLLMTTSIAAFAQQVDDWSFHLQSTTITQGHGAFNSPYSASLSLMSIPEIKTSQTITFFAGRRLWSGGEFYFNPEMSAGTGLSGTHGIAGFSNGEIYRVDTADPKVTISRLYVQQIFGLGGASQKIPDDKNQLGETVNVKRVTVAAGKFSLNDFFDNNAFAHDPRTQFLNWSLMDNAAWDYAADTRGYTWGLYFEINQPDWAFRVASVLEPTSANQIDLEMDLTKAHGDNAEFEWRYKLKNESGKLRFLYYQNHAHMGSYRLALNSGASIPDVTSNRDSRIKYGYGINLEQEINEVLAVTSRWGWNDGATETWAFTEVDSTFTLGINLKGKLWKRDGDNLGLAFITNGLSQDHIDYVTAGGVGFIIGDGHLSYDREEILEFYYVYKILDFLSFTADYQFVNHPAYNQDRGPVSILAARAHLEF